MGPSKVYSTRGLPFRVDQLLGGRLDLEDAGISTHLEVEPRHEPKTTTHADRQGLEDVRDPIPRASIAQLNEVEKLTCTRQAN